MLPIVSVRLTCFDLVRRCVSVSFEKIYHSLSSQYGKQHWWPGDTPFEVMVGAVLTQNTAWINVEKALDNLKAAQLLNAKSIVACELHVLAEHLRPSGYFNIKAKRLQNYCRWYLAQGEYKMLSQWKTDTLRNALLAVNGIGPETADDILLYAFDRPVFVIDAYTRRLFSRLGLVGGEEAYETLRAVFEDALSHKRAVQRVRMFNVYHALIVRHAKEACRTKPLCDLCCLQEQCEGVHQE